MACVPSPRALTAAALREHLLVTGLAGTVSTPREQSLQRYRLFAARDPRVLSGLEPARDWTVTELLTLMSAECGVSADPADVTGSDIIDPDRTIAALGVFADRLAAAVSRRTPVLLGTGRPGGLLAFYVTLAEGLSAAGCPVLTPAQGRSIDMTTRFGLRPLRLDYVRRVALVHDSDSRPSRRTPGAHTRSPLPLRAVLDEVVAGRHPCPGLVIGDRGWVCGAGQLGIEAAGPAGTDDPAVFVGQAEGRVSVAVPVADTGRAEHYEPVTRYVLNRAVEGLSL